MLDTIKSTIAAYGKLDQEFEIIYNLYYKHCNVLCIIMYIVTAIILSPFSKYITYKGIYYILR